MPNKTVYISLFFIVLVGMIEKFILAPFYIWPLAILIPFFYFYYLKLETRFRMRIFGWLVLISCNFFETYSWIPKSISSYFHFPQALSLFISLIIFGFIYSHVLAFFCLISLYEKKRIFQRYRLISYPVTYCLCEIALHGWRIFPFDLGHGLYGWSAAYQLLAFGGTGLATFATCLMAFLIFGAVTDRGLRTRFILILLATACAIELIGMISIADVNKRLVSATRLQIGWVQTNFAPMLGKPGSGDDALSRIKTMDASNRRLAKLGAKLVVWPESASPIVVDTSSGELELIGRFVDFTPVPILTGFIESSNGNYFGSAVLLEANHDRYRLQTDVYRKTALIPFAESQPPVWNLILPEGALAARMNFLSSPNAPAPLISKSLGLKAGLLICYDALFPWIARTEVEKGANLLVNIANDSWFFETDEPYQHFFLALAPAVEMGRALLRVTNGGSSALILPNGAIEFGAPPGSTAENSAAIPLLEGHTFYYRFGNAWLILLTALAIFLEFGSSVKLRTISRILGLGKNRT